MKLGFVCTNYNNSSYTKAAITSLRSCGHCDDVRVVVVDNQSTADDVAVLEDFVGRTPGVMLVRNSENVGYFPGLNIGIQHLRMAFPNVEHIVIGNNDLEFSPDFVDTVERLRDVFDRWAVVAPDLVTPNGSHQNPHVIVPISPTRKLVWDLFYHSYGMAVIINFFAQLTRRFTARPEIGSENGLYEMSGPILQGYGACYVLGPLFFKHFVGLCAPTFLMQEEFFLSEQLKSIGQMPYYDPRFVVRHMHHATMVLVKGRRHWTISREAHQMYKRYLRMSRQEQIRFLDAWTKAFASSDLSAS